MAASPLANITNMSVRVTIKVDGSAISDAYGLVSVNITHEVNRISAAEIILRAEVSIEDSSIAISDSDDFKPGKKVVISAGFGDSGETSIFEGFIIKHALDIDTHSGSTVRLLCKHAAVKMTFNETEATFTEKKDSDIITSIIGTYGITTTVDATTTPHDFVFQHMSTDWDFILARAEFNGFIITLDNDKITVGKPALSAASVLRLAVGDSIQSFSAEINAENQPSGIEAHAWDIKTQATISSTAAEPTVNTQGTMTGVALGTSLSQSTLKLISPTPMPTDELKVWADGVLLRKRLSAFRGTVKFIGSALVKPGSLVDLENVGARFNGSAFVSTVNHVIEEGGWNTTIKIGLDNSPVSRKQGFSYSAAGGQLPSIHGLQIGTVKKLSADPGNENRIQVTIPSNATTEASVWARVANFYATGTAGSGFLPEIGDEVVIGFFDNDPRFPVVIGSLYSSKNAPAYPAKDENNYTKAFTTKAKLEITFDDEKKVITIKTPGKNMVTISDDAKSIEMKDQNSNSIKMSASGIDIESAKDINIKATGKITLDATGKATVSSKADIALEGMNIQATAQLGFTAKGNATAEVSASGQTTIKGAMVMIN